MNKTQLHTGTVFPNRNPSIAEGKAVLTTESTNSHYGIPVLRIGSVDYGPKDHTPNGRADKVAIAISRGNTELEHLAKLFCAQWPEGTQPRE